jgi:intracellular septation protein
MSETTRDLPKSAKPDHHQLLKPLMELGPLALFGLVYWRTGDIFWGLTWFMAATVIALVASRIVFKRIALMPLVSGIAVLIFGGLTLWLQDETFIKIKPTIVNLLFAGVLLGGVAFGQSFIKFVFSEAFQLTDEGWKVLTVRWACFFIALACLNELVWRTCSSAFWWSFKAWGMMPLTLGFALAQFGLIKRYAAHSEGSIPARRTDTAS